APAISSRWRAQPTDVAMKHMDGAMTDLAATEWGSQPTSRKPVGINEYEHLLEREGVWHAPRVVPSLADLLVWAHEADEGESRSSVNELWGEVVELLGALRMNIEAYRAARTEFEVWARVERAAIDRERAILRARVGHTR